MRAIVVGRPGGPEVLELRDVPEPAAGEGRLLVDVEAAGVNFRDVYEREGQYGTPMPLVAGVEGAGTVVEVGPGVQGVSPGDRVGWVRAQGSYAERIALDAELAIPVPGGVPGELAAAALLQGMTAQYLAALAYPVKEGDTVIVHAAAGGVGLLLTQLVKLRGGRVLATTSTEEKAELARSAGADEVLGYEDFAARARELGGVHAVYDGIAAATFDDSLAALRQFGTLVLYGSASGPAPPVDPMRLMKGSLYLTRPTLNDYADTRERALELAGAVFDRIAAGELDVRIGGRYPLADAARAHEDLEARRTTGKLLVVPR